MEIRGRLLYRGIQHPDGSIISDECRIEIPEKVPIVYETKLWVYDAIGFATVTKDDLGLIFTGYIKDDVKCSLTVSIRDHRPCYCGAELREVWRESEGE